MCEGPKSKEVVNGGSSKMMKSSSSSNSKESSLVARYVTAGITGAVFSVWGKATFIPESETPGAYVPMYSFHHVLYLTVGYLISLPLLKFVTEKYLAPNWDMKLLLKESMILYNVAQVALNGWMVWKFVDAVVNKGHPFIGDITTVKYGTVYAIWVHYCDKYLEFFDTYFMVLRGRMDQVCIHTHTHTNIYIYICMCVYSYYHIIHVTYFFIFYCDLCTYLYIHLYVCISELFSLCTFLMVMCVCICVCVVCII